MFNLDIVPEESVGPYKLGLKDSELEKKIGAFSKRLEAGRIVYVADDYTFYVNPQTHLLYEIIVSGKFAGNFKGVRLGTTMKDTIELLGSLKNTADDYFCLQGEGGEPVPGLLFGFPFKDPLSKLEWIAVFLDD